MVSLALQEIQDLAVLQVPREIRGQQDNLV